MKNINILDTSQLIEDPNIIKWLAENADESIIYIPKRVEKELSHNFNNKILDEKLARNVALAKQYIDSYRKKIIFWEMVSFPKNLDDGGGDQAIRLLVLQELGMRTKTPKNIYVFTNDSNLGSDCEKLARLKSVHHNCSVKAVVYQGDRVYSLFPQKKYPYELRKLEAIGWRNGRLLQEFSTNNSICIENCPSVPDPHISSSKALKYWLWYAKAGDVLKIYKKMSLSRNQIVKAEVMTYDTNSHPYARLVAYKESNGRECASNYVFIGNQKWNLLELALDGFYDYINVEIVLNNSSQFNGAWDGHDGFITNFKIYPKLEK